MARSKNELIKDVEFAGTDSNEYNNRLIARARACPTRKIAFHYDSEAKYKMDRR